MSTTTRGHVRASGWRRRAVASAASLAVVGGALTVPALTTSAMADEAPELPDVIPSLTDWSAGDGSFSLESGVQLVAEGEAAERGALFVEELEAILDTDVPVVAGDAGAGDIALTIDESRNDDLGDEGYELTIGESIEIEAAASQGVFYGTRTLAQMLGQQAELPAGSTVDVPQFEERGVTLCACQINVSTDWIERLMEEMSHLKLNYLLLELKVKSAKHPETATWSYYTPEQIRDLDARAQAYGIEMIPEINSPGHMGIWLENLEHLQLLDQNGNPDEFRLDITTDEAFEFYTSLMDEYLEAFSSDYWHMGADEYMIDTAFDNYPQVEAYAKETWGDTATPQDTYVDYINQINDYVKDTHGKTLRIWNDGLRGDNNVVEIDSDIVVESWQNSPVTPQQLIDDGHRVMNAAYNLYLVRGASIMNTANLYNNSSWDIGTFYGGHTLPLDTEGFIGGKISLWPDTASAQTENEVEEQMFMPLRFISQMTWTAEREVAQFSEFETIAREIGRPIFWNNVDRQPVEGGTYTIASTDGGLLGAEDSALSVGDDVAQSWALSPTSDGYYRIAAADSGRSLDVVDGQHRLTVPVGIGVDVIAAEPRDSNIQKWQVIDEGDNGFAIVNASSQQHLALNDEGAVVQLPFDMTDSRWELTSSLSAGSVSANPGASIEVPVSVTNTTDEDYTSGSVTVELPEGWDEVPAVEFDTLAAGASTDLTLAVSVPEDAFPGDYTVPVTVTTDQGVIPGVFTLTVNAPEGELITVRASHTNPTAAGQYAVGDRLSFTFTVTNLLDRVVTIVPSGALESFDPETSGSSCRYRNLGANASYDCITGFHIVTQADLDAGSFTPVTTWNVHDGGEAGPVISTVERQAPRVVLTPDGEQPTEEPTPPAEPETIPQWQITIEDVSSEQTAVSPGLAEYTLDGSTQTIWHNEWAVTEGPHHIAFNLGVEYWVDSLVYTPRQTDSRNGVLKDYEVYVSSDPEEWGEPVAAGTLEDTWADSVLDLEGSVGQYVKLVYLDSYNDTDEMTNATAAEINFTGVLYTGEEPTEDPTEEPTEDPTEEPTEDPTTDPTEEPTDEPTEDPTDEPTEEPTTEEPTTEEPTTGVEPVVAVSSPTAQVGETVTIAGTGFQRGETVELSIDDQVVATATADADGAFSIELEVPAGTEPGDYLVLAQGLDSGLTAEVALTVTAAGMPDEDPSEDGDELPSTGASATPLVAGALLLLLVGGAALVGRRYTAAG